MNEAIMCTVFGLATKLVQWLVELKCGPPVTGVALPVGCGKSWITSHMQQNRHTVLLDVEEAVRLNVDDATLTKLDGLKASGQMTSYNSMMYILCRDYLDTQRKSFKKNKYVVFSSDRELLKYVGCRDIVCASPSNAFFEKIVSNIDGDEKKKLAGASRSELLLSIKNKAELHVFDSWTELGRILSDSLGLKYKL